MEPLARLDSNSILAEDIFLEIFDQEDEIMKARMILSLTDRAAELGVKKKFEELLKAYKKVDREAKQRERKKPIAMLDKWTNFEGPYNNMFCGAWIAGEDGVYAQNDSQVDAVACYHPILPVERMKNLETGEEQIKIAYKRNGRWDEIIVPKTMVTSASKIVALSGRGISVTSENAKLLVRFLSDVENMNDSHIKGYTWRGRMAMKVIEPPAGSDYRVVSGELNAILKKMIEPEFGGLYVVPGTDTGVTVSNYQFDRYCTLLEGITKMLKSVGYRLSIRHKREKGIPGYVLIEAVPVVDHSDEIELSKDCGLNYTMEDKRNGVNHLIVTGKGELQNRNVFHLYVWPDGSFKKTQYYKGLDEIAQVYENTSTETDELESQSTKKLQDLCSKKTFGMDIAKLGIDVGIGDIVGGRDYLTGMYSSKPIENIIYSITNRIESKEYELEGENDNGDS